MQEQSSWKILRNLVHIIKKLNSMQKPTINIEALRKHSFDVVGAIYEVHNELGPGLSEYVYQEGLAMQLKEQSIEFSKEQTFHPMYHGCSMTTEFRMDFVCKGNIIVECKSVLKLAPEHRAQLFNYMRLMKLPVGILVNFSTKSAQVERYFYDEDQQEIYGSDGYAVNQFTAHASKD